MARWNAPFEVEQVKQLALIARLSTHHGKSLPPNPSADGITVHRKSRALFQQHRPTSTFTSAIRKVRGSAAPTRTPIVC
jgi:hypothetical protein